MTHPETVDCTRESDAAPRRGGTDRADARPAEGAVIASAPTRTSGP